MKKFLLVVLGVLAFCPVVHAGEGKFCGGFRQYTADCVNNNRNWHVSCCPDGYRVQGVAYNDIEGKDDVDAVSAVCRNIARGNDMMPSDFGRHPKQFVCKNSEVMAGIFAKDKRSGKDNADGLDGVTAICQHPGSTNLRQIANNDLESNPRHGRELTVLLPKRVIGLAYKEMDKGSSDRADCVTIITK